MYVQPEEKEVLRVSFMAPCFAQVKEAVGDQYFEELYNSPNVSSLAAHASAAVVAAGSRQQRLKIYDLNNRTRFTVKAHSDFWGSRLGSVTALRFHPTQQLLAAGAANDHLSVFSYDANSWTTMI